MKRGARYAAALVVLLCFVATGCLSGDASLKVKGDGAGEFKVKVFPPGAARVPLRQVKIDQLLEDALAASSGTTVKSIKQDGFSGYEIVVPFDDVDEMVSAMNTPMPVGAHKLSLFSQFSLVRQTEEGKDHWRLDATLNSLDQFLAPLAGDATFAKVGESVKAGETNQPMDMTFVVDLPGEIVNSNATKRGGGSATWEITKSSVPTVITARSEPSDFPTTLQKGLLAAAGVIVLGLILLGASKWASRSAATRRLTRSERKAAKARLAETGWGPKGPASMPTTTAPSSDIGRDLPGMAPGSQPQPGTYDPVRGVRIGHTPTSDIPAPLIGVDNEHPHNHDSHGRSAADHEAHERQLREKAEQAEKARKKAAKKLKKGQSEGQVPPVQLPAAVPVPAPTGPPPGAAAPAPATPAPEPAPEPEPAPLRFSIGIPEGGVAEGLDRPTTGHGPVSDREVAEAVADAFGGSKGLRGWLRGPLTDRQVAEAVVEALSESAPAPQAEEGEGEPGQEISAEPDWYPDPDDPTRLRWWSGAEWTDYVS